MSPLEETLTQFVAEETSLETLRAVAEADPTELGNRVLALLTQYENSDWSEAELRVHAADLLAPRED
jgi:hypothetical protein